jgi:hypothetical protein
MHVYDTRPFLDSIEKERIMNTNRNEQGGIRAKHIEAENVVSGIQIQGGEAQTAAALVSLAHAIQRGEISAEEIKARNLVSGLQYISDPTQASIEDLRREVASLYVQLEQAITAHEISDIADANGITSNLTIIEAELAMPQPDSHRVLGGLDELSQIVTRSAETAESAGKLGALVIRLAPVFATLWQVAQRHLGV